MDKKLKIAFLNKYQGKVNRGAETFVKELSERLTDDFDVDVISKINFLEILKKKYDVIIPTNGREQVIITKIICLFTGSKMIVSGQSGIGADDKWNLVCFPDYFISLTNFQQKWANKFNPFVKTKVISNGVDLKKFSSNIKPIKLDLPRPIVLSVGALEDIKRQDLIIKTVSKTKASLLIVGTGSRRKHLEELGEKLMPGRFIIQSFPYERMPGVYSGSDLFTYPTQSYESFGIAMVEAMASNLPVISNDDPIRREIVGEAGFFVNPENIKTYTDTLQTALNTKWGSIPRKHAEKFNWDNVAAKYKSLFLSLK